MKQVHVECKPDEALIKKLGFTKKAVIHHRGKSRVFRKLESVSNQLALVDEDPGSVKSGYEKKLKMEQEAHGIKLYSDKSGNKILILKGKLEDWIVTICIKSGIKLGDFSLPEKPNDLHDVINERITKFENLIDHLLKNKSIEPTQRLAFLNQ